MKKFIFLITCLIIPLLSWAEEYSGTTGDCTWHLNTNTGVLTISGSGSMNNYGGSSSPWYSYRTSINTVVINNGVTSIGDYAFYYCSGLTSITIPSSVTYIGYDAFYGCSGLTKVIVPDIEAWCNIYFETNYFSSNYDEIHHFCNPLWYAHHLYSDENTEITNLVIPSSVTSIGRWAFMGCSGLTSVTIPSSVTSIENGAFCCTGLTSITIPSSVTYIGYEAFGGCSGLTKVIVPDIEAWCNINFVYCHPDYMYLNFSSNPLYYAHHLYSDENTEITNLVFPEGVTYLGAAFAGWLKLTSVTIPEGVKSITGTFAGCSELTSVTIPSSVTNIGFGAFCDCSELTSVTIPSSVTSIYFNAFWGSGLKKVKVDINSPLTLDEGVFSNRSNATLYVPKGFSSAYSYAIIWNDFGTIKEFPDSDVNQDDVVDVVDVVDIARYVIDTPSDTFDDFLADINIDDNVNIADAVALVNEIVGDQDFTKARRAPMNEDDEWLTLTETDEQNLSISLDNVRDYTAFQFDLYASDNAVIQNVVLNKLRKQKHQLLYNKLGDGHYRIVCLSTSNKVFNGTDGELLCIETEGFNIDNIILKDIHFFTVDGGDYSLRYVKQIGEATDIDEVVRADESLPEDGAWYTITGAKFDTKPSVPGVYIHNGRKILVK